MQLSSSGHSCWGLWPHSNYSICFLISVWTLVITAAFVVLWHPRPSTATRRDSGTEPEGSGSARPRAREQHRGRKGEVRMRRRNKITEMTGIIFHISLPSTSCREQRVPQALSGWKWSQELLQWVSLKCELLGGSSVDFPEVWKMYVSALQAITRDKCTHLLLPSPHEAGERHTTSHSGFDTGNFKDWAL